MPQRLWARIAERYKRYPDEQRPVIHGRADVVLRFLDSVFVDDAKGNTPVPPVSYFLLFAGYAVCFELLATLAVFLLGGIEDLWTKKAEDLHFAFLLFSPYLATMALYQSRRLPALLERTKVLCGLEEEFDALRSKIQDRSGSLVLIIVIWIASFALSVMGTIDESEWRSIRHAFGPSGAEAIGFWMLRTLVAVNFYFILCLAVRWSVLCILVIKNVDSFKFDPLSDHGGADALAELWHHAFATFCVFTIYLAIYIAPGWGNGINTSTEVSVVMLAFFVTFLLLPIARVPAVCATALRVWKQKLGHDLKNRGPRFAWDFLYSSWRIKPPYPGDDAVRSSVKDANKLTTKGIWLPTKDFQDWLRTLGFSGISAIVVFLGFPMPSFGALGDPHTSSRGAVPTKEEIDQFYADRAKRESEEDGHTSRALSKQNRVVP